MPNYITQHGDYSQGPWTLVKGNAGGEFYMWQVKAADHPRRTIAKLSRFVHTDSAGWEAAQANANLIIASPMMLAALIKIRDEALLDPRLMCALAMNQAIHSALTGEL